MTEPPRLRPKLHVVTVSTRPGRAGLPVSTWIFERARSHGGLEVEHVDLKEENLPMFDESPHPRLRQYEHEHTKRWSAKVDAADAFVFVTPEYDHGTAPSLMVKPMMAALKMVVVHESVMVPLFANGIDDKGTFKASELQETFATMMLDALVKWTKALAPMRA